jgi:uncharacterized protein (TIGR03435 family)
MRKSVAASTLAAIIVSAAVLAQQPSFDAAVFRLNRSGADGSSIGQRPGGQYLMTNGPIYLLLMNAFGPQNRQLVGAPDWVMSERYDLQATANATTTSDALRQMLRNLLAERLRLQAHLEPREQPVYFLVPVRPDKRLGPGIERTARDCASVEAADRAGLPRPVLTPPLNGASPCGVRIVDGEFLAGGQTMEGLARNFGSRAGRPVFDRTGIEGYFDVTLRFSVDLGGSADAPPFVTALSEQLGLRLEAGRAPLQTLVIDHIERPSEN